MMNSIYRRTLESGDLPGQIFQLTTTEQDYLKWHTSRYRDFAEAIIGERNAQLLWTVHTSVR